MASFTWMHPQREDRHVAPDDEMTVSIDCPPVFDERVESYQLLKEIFAWFGVTQDIPYSSEQLNDGLKYIDPGLFGRSGRQ